MGVEAREIGLAAPEPARAVQASGFISPGAFWAMLAGAVLVLLGVIVRVVRSTE